MSSLVSSFIVATGFRSFSRASLVPYIATNQQPGNGAVVGFNRQPL